MDVIKNHYEKIIFGAALAFLAWILFSLKGDLVENTERAADFTVEDTFAGADKEPVKSVNEAEFISGDSVKDSSKVQWVEGDQKVMQVPRYIVCSDEACGHVIPFESKECPYCKADQGLTKKDEELQTYALADDDKDGILNAVEDAFDFLDKDNPDDAYLDFDGNGFCNIQEINGTLSEEEIKSNFLKKKLFVHDPKDPKDHPALVSLLRIEESNQAKSMGITLKSVSEEGEKKSEWLIAFNSTRTGKTVTRFKRLKEEVVTNTGMKLVIENIDKKITKKWNPRIKEHKTIIDYTVVLRSATGEVYKVKKDEFVKEGSKTVQFVYLNDHHYRRLPRFEVEEGGKFDLAAKAGGKVIRTEKFSLVKIGRSSVKIKRLEDGKSFDIKMFSDQDKTLIGKRYAAVRKSLSAKK